MKFSFNLGALFNFFRRGKKKNTDEEAYPGQKRDERNYEIRKNFIYSSGMFNLIKSTYQKQNVQLDNAEKYDRAVLDTCIGILTNMEELTEKELEEEFNSGWECATGKLLSSFTYVAMVEDLWNNHIDELVKYIKDYNALNLD